MLKSLTSVRIIVVLAMSFLIAFGVEIIDVDIEFFWSWIMSFLFTLSLMEMARLLGNKVVKNEKSTFSYFIFAYLVLALVVSSLLMSFLQLSENAKEDLRLYIGGVILVIGVFQSVYFWIRKNGQERARLIVEKQAYLQHSFNALKSQNVIEFLQGSLTKTIDLIKTDPTVAVQQIEKLTSILRYLLQSRDERFVKLGAELKNVEEYCELAEIHLSNEVNLTISITNQFYNTKIPPLVFQMVLDNQFKSFSETNEDVLNIEVYIENNKFVVVKTSLPPILNPDLKNEKFINNLKQRYQLYNKASGVSELSTNNEYFVKFPLVVG